jgi:glutamate-ammonia-ligase adenylyltransferase
MMMTAEQLRACLASPDAARTGLAGWGVRDTERARRNLLGLGHSVGGDRLRDLAGPLGRALPRTADPDMALNNLERVLARTGDGPALAGLLEGRARGLETLLQLLAVSQFLADLLAGDPGLLDTVTRRPAAGRSPGPADLAEQLRAEADAAENDAAVLRAIRRFRQRHTLRIGVNDVLRDRPLEEITGELSRLADAALRVALDVALRNMAARFGTPHTADGPPARLAAFAFGKLGGEELNYSSDIDLMFVYDEDGTTRGRGGGLDNASFYAKVVGEVVRLLSAHTDRGQAYRVDLRLRPEGHRGPLTRSLAATLSYYDALGRTWERQALVKLRPVAGDVELGREFAAAVEPFVYRKYLSVAEIHDIKAMKRRIEQKARQAGDDDRDVKTGRGGIRDIEFVVQFLQLLNGGDLPELRQRNTLLAVQALEAAGCLTNQEFHILDDAYRFLRKTEHRLQLVCDLQTHRLPDAPDELRKLARRMGYDGPAGPSRPRPRREPSLLDDAPPPRLDARDLIVEPLDAFLHDLHERSRLTRQILDHLLHQAFPGDAPASEPESDLVLDPNPDEAAVAAALGRYPFKDVPAAARNLAQLAQESVPFLSSRRCRHFLAAIAPRLLQALAETPDPDEALVNLEKVTASLGAKAILWELFSVSPPALKLCVELCASSPFFTDLLTNNPGMIDELLDSLILNRPRSPEELREELTELCRAAEDPEPILHSFRDKETLRVGARDILGKDGVRETTAALSDIAEAVVAQVARWQEPAVTARLGAPRLADGRPCRWTLLALGKLGGREMGYHSDLDLVFLYEGEGRTEPPPGRAAAENGPYFTELAQRIVKATSRHGPMGRLYAIDQRLRPTGKSGSLVVPLGAFERYHAPGGGAQTWERQALTRARPVAGDPAFAAEVVAAVERAAYGRPWTCEAADEVRAMRGRLHVGASPRSLKRVPGGLIDVEFLVQMLQLKHGPANASLRVPSTWAALDTLHAAGLLDADDHTALRDGYAFLRGLECRLRLVTNRAATELPEPGEELDKLARRLGYGAADAGAKLLADRETHAGRVRDAFERVWRRER